MTRAAAGNSLAFRLVYPLAFLGAHLAFMPLLVLLLPRRVTVLAPGDPVVQLSVLLLAGGVIASVAHIGAGHWSDRVMARSGSRRMPIAVGLGALTLSYVGLAAANSLPGLLAALVAFQLALNLMFAPLGALLADYVEDGRKARMTAWLSLALPLSIAASAVIASVWPEDSVNAFAMTAVAVAACVLPLLLSWPSGPALRQQADQPANHAPSLPMRDFQLAWAARLLVQCGATLVIHYLYVYLASLPASAEPPLSLESAMSQLLAFASVTGAVATLLAGRVSDLIGRRRLPMSVSGLTMAAGLLLLATGPSWAWIVFGYCLFSASLTVFLSIDSAMVATLLGRSQQRGKWLGVMNLTNTLPAIITPALALGAVEITAENGLSYLLVCAAGAASAASILVLRLRTIA